MKKMLSRLFKFTLIFIFIFIWIFSGYPQIFNFSIKTSSVKAATISFVGSAVGSSSPNTGTTVNISGIGIQAGDLILVAAAVGDNANNGLAAPTQGGYSRVPGVASSLYANGTSYDTNLDLYYKIANGTETTVSFAAVGGTNASNAAVVMVFRGVDTNTPFDTNANTATGTGTSNADPPSHDWSGASGVWTVIAASTGHSGSTSAYFTFPTGYTTNAAQRTHNDSCDVLVGMGYNSSPSDPENPAALSATNIGTASANSWAAVTMSLKPAPPPTFNQSAYRFFENQDSTNVGNALANQDTAATLSYSGQNFRLRLLLHVAGGRLLQSGQSFKLQFGTSTGGSCSSSPPSSWNDITTSTPIAFYDNPTPADGATLTANANDPTHGTDTIVNQTYEELNNFTNSVAAIPAGQDGKWDFSLKDNNSSPTVATYCLRVVKSDGSLLDTYSVTPQITTSNVTSWVTGSLGKTTDSWYGVIPVYMEVHGDISTSTYPYARAMVQTPISETYYTSMNWNNTTNRFEGVIYVGSWYCHGCADPNTGTYNVTVQLDNDPNFGSIDYQASAGSFTTFITRRWNAVNTTAMGYGTEFNPTWNGSGGYWDYYIDDFSIGGSASARTNVAFAIPFHPVTANISNISVTLAGSSIPQGSPASTTDCWWWDSNTHTFIYWEDFNDDGVLDIVDLSILLYYWTG